MRTPENDLELAAQLEAINYVRGGVAQLLQDPLNAPHRAMNLANIDFNDALTFPMLDDLHMGERPRNAVTHFRKASAVALTWRAISHAENLREQAGIADFPISE